MAIKTAVPATTEITQLDNALTPEQHQHLAQQMVRRVVDGVPWDLLDQGHTQLDTARTEHAEGLTPVELADLSEVQGHMRWLIAWQHRRKLEALVAELDQQRAAVTAQLADLADLG